MRRSRKPRTPIEFLLLAGIVVAGMAFIYVKFAHTLEQITKPHSAQQPVPKPPVAAPATPSRPAEPSDAEIQRYREIAEAYRAADRRKQEAWERFYQPPRACLHPESVQRAEVCRANEQKQRKEFESAWAEQLLRERQAQQ